MYMPTSDAEFKAVNWVEGFKVHGESRCLGEGRIDGTLDVDLLFFMVLGFQPHDRVVEMVEDPSTELTTQCKVFAEPPSVFMRWCKHLEETA